MARYVGLRIFGNLELQADGSSSQSFLPGSGTPPPAPAGLDVLIERAAVALDRIRSRRGRTKHHSVRAERRRQDSFTRQIRLDAEARGLVTVAVEIAGRALASGPFRPPLRRALIKLSRTEAAKHGVKRALRALAGFAKLTARFGDLEVVLDLEPEPGLADSGNLDFDLAELLAAVEEAAAERDTAIVLFIDELHYVPESQLAALIGALHAVNQRQLPVTMVGAGLPQLPGASGRAKSCAERLFEFVSIDRLDLQAAAEALQRTIEREGVAIDEDAIAEIIVQTFGYPISCRSGASTAEMLRMPCRSRSPTSAKRGSKRSPSSTTASSVSTSIASRRGEKRYLRAMADLGPGPYRSGDIAERLGRKVNKTAPIRNSLIGKGMLYSAAHGDTAFTVPLFD